jgi:hypothetical protein
MMGMVFSGVDLSNPFGPGPATDNRATIPDNLDVTTQADWMAIGFGYGSSQNNPRDPRTIDAPASQACTVETSDGMTGCHGAWGMCGYYLASGALTQIPYSLGSSDEATAYGWGLRPAVGLRARAVQYYFNIWDPKPKVIDVQGREIPPDQLRADSWLEMQGAKLPQSEVYDSFVSDPTKARIVEVGSRESGATLRASRSQFADVLIKRAAAGRG